MAVEILFCYARKDERLLNSLKAHLEPMRREGLIDLWYDRDISAGADWKREINTHLNTAQIILLLISSDFIASDYCYSVEMKRALDRHEQGEACVIPIILRPTDWENTPLSGLQALPKDGKAITTWRRRDDAYLDITKGLRKAIEKMSAKSSLPLIQQAKTKNEHDQSQPEEHVYITHTQVVDEEAIAAKIREEMQRQREADNLLLEAHRFAASLMEKDELVKKAINLYPLYKQRELRQLGIEISTVVINGYDPVTQRGIMIAGLGRGISGYGKLERNEIPLLAASATVYLRENVLEAKVPDAEGLFYLACMYGYQQQFEYMTRLIEKTIKINKEMKEKFQQRKIIRTILRACDADLMKLERLRKSLDIPRVTKKTFCEFLQDFDLAGFNGFIEWIAVKRPNLSGEKGTFLIKITPPYPSNEGKVSASAQSIESWSFETIISASEPVTIEELYDELYASFMLFCPIS